MRRRQRRCSLTGAIAGDGGFFPADCYRNRNQYPSLPFPTNQHYFQNPPNLFPTASFQNPSFFQYPNPYLLNPALPHARDPSLNSHPALEPIEPGVVKAQKDNAAAAARAGGGGVRGLKMSQASSQTPNCELSNSVSNAGDPSLESRQTLERVEAAVVIAKQDITAAGENVSAWRVSQAALVALKADSWSSLGLQLQEVPTLRHLLILEGKVNAFIHCYVAAQRITSLYDLEVALCKNEGIERFCELELGPLCRHPLVEHYFSVPSNFSEVFEITTEEIIGFLRTFIKKCHKMFSAEEFLDFVAQKKSTSAKEMLGVRIGSLGFHIYCLREAEKSERATIKRFSKLPKSDVQGEIKGQEPVPFLQKKTQDHRFASICKRVSAFSSAWDAFAGKHTRFECSESDEDRNYFSEDSDYLKDDCAGKDASSSWNQSTYSNGNSKHASGCPYPSTLEDMARLGLKLEKNEQSPSGNKIAKESKGDKSYGKKRKDRENDYTSTKHLKKRKSDSLETLTRSTITEDFVAHWGDACLQYSVSEVLDMMLDYYTKNAEQKKHMEKLFSSDPALGLLNVAVASIKYALEADQNVTIQNLGDQKFSSQLSTKKMKEKCQGDIVEFQMGKFILKWKEACIKHSVYEVLHLMFDFYGTNKKKRMKKLHSSYPGIGIVLVAVTSIKHGILDSLCHMFKDFGEQGNHSRNHTSMSIPENWHVPKERACRASQSKVNVNDIIQKIADYIQSETLVPKENLSFKRFQPFKKLLHCERWLMDKFSAEEFSSLGHGNFIEFLERHASIFPREFYNFFVQRSCETPQSSVSISEQHLEVFLSQARYNWRDSNVVNSNAASMLLKRQFPTISFCINGDDPDKYFSSLVEKHSESLKSVLFSATLLGKQDSEMMQEDNEEYLQEATGFLRAHNSVLTVTLKNAIECLLEAPMLSDLCAWSHWDIVYAPSFGPLIEWLYEAHVEEILCIVTRNGKLIKVDPSAIIDDFLESFLQCSSFKMAVKLLSLLALYRGTNKAPISLLKSYAKRASDVVIKNSINSMEFKAAGEDCSLFLEDLKTTWKLSEHSCLKDDEANFELVKDEIMLGKSLSKVNEGIVVIAKFILESLSYLPSEFWCFAADILFSGLRSYTKEAPSVILRECRKLDHRLMLHEIGLSLGVIEWIQDYEHFRRATSVARTFQEFSYPLGAESSSMTSKDASHILANTYSSHDSLLVNGDDGFLPDNCHGMVDKIKEKDPYVNGDNLNKQMVTNANADNFDMLEEKKIKDANLVIEAIRKEEFGLDQQLNNADSLLLKKQHARLARALHCLSQELYSKDSHLLLELVQNADDNIYPDFIEPTVVFILQENGIVILNNEQGFSAQNIRALCDIGNSTKKGHSSGYIGHKGIGFKSVFRVTDAPEIHSNGFHIKFDITNGQIGFVLPTVVPPCDINMFEQLLSGEGLQNDGNWNTCIILPFKSKFKEVTNMSSILSLFLDLHPSFLLFLHRLRCIKFKNMLNGTSLVMKKQIMNDGIIKVSHGKEAMSWLLVSKRLQATVIRHDVQNTEIALAFTLQETDEGEYKPYLNLQPVFAFLPLRNYGLKFILQGDFDLPSSREEVDGDSAWNQWLLSEFPALFASAEQSFCSLPCFRNNLGKAVTAYISFVPLVGEVHGFFSHLPHMIISKLRMSNCLLLNGPSSEWVLPCRVLRGWNEQTCMLLSDNLLQKHLGLGYLNRDIFLSDPLAKALGVKDYGPHVLVDILSSLCCLKGGIKSLGLGWVSSWLFNLSLTLSSQSSLNLGLNAQWESDLISSLRKIPFIPLSDGSYSSISDGSIWLPHDTIDVGYEGTYSLKDFPNLYGKFRIVDPMLFSASTTSYSLRETRADDLVNILYKIGVQHMSAHEVMKTHVLVALCDHELSNGSGTWRVEYLSFILVHFQSNCASCHSKKADIISELREKATILTDEGYKCAINEPIHFGKEYGNSVDIGKLIGSLNLKWLEVDVAYLKHPSVHSLSSGIVKWREFFHELGVTDFVQVYHVKKHVSDTLLSRSFPCIGDLIRGSLVISDYESSELVTFLSTFSSKNCREQCIYFLELLDKMWDDHYSLKVACSVVSAASQNSSYTESSFIKSIREIKWIASDVDEELHYPAELYCNCQEICSIMGHMVPYAIPKVTSKAFLKEIGFRTQLSYCDALNVIRHWSTSHSPLLASAAQMSKFYTYISDGIQTLQVKLTEEFMSSSFIFIPFPNTSRDDHPTHGVFYAPKDVYWHDPTGCIEKTQEMLMQHTLSENSNCIQCNVLSTTYPGLHDFFVHNCCVQEVPSFGIYVQILRQLSSVALPSQAAHSFHRVLLRWSDDFESKSVKAEEILKLKEELHRLDCRILPTIQDNWVSLHPSFGLICWVDDVKLRKKFKHSRDIDFLHLGELVSEDNNKISRKIAVLMKSIGVPALSEVVIREAISSGTGDSREKICLINWVLPYVQRYIFKNHPEMYFKLKQQGFQFLHRLKVVIVEKLYYKYTLKGKTIALKKRFECSSLFQGFVLYALPTTDCHSIFLELSRLFFDGAVGLHLANFLHMITTMAESGSTNEQIEFFVVNSQRIPQVPDEEPIWILTNVEEQIQSPNNQLPNTVTTSVERSKSIPAKKPGIILNWPPTDWKTAPGYSWKDHLGPRLGPQVQLREPPEFATQSAPLQVGEEFILEDGLESRGVSMLQDSELMKDQSSLVGSCKNAEAATFPAPRTGLTVLPNWQKDKFCVQASDDQHFRYTGWLGEMIAYKFFKEKRGFEMVKWMNEANETGFPYDLIIGDNNSREFIEVKTTRSATKDWFEISTREWQFATQMGESFSIARVVLIGKKKASISILKNPVKLCQQSTLGLAILMPRG